MNYMCIYIYILYVYSMFDYPACDFLFLLCCMRTSSDGAPRSGHNMSPMVREMTFAALVTGHLHATY